MKKFMAALLLVASPGLAANYYVDFDGGVDSAGGSMGSPWKHAPGDPLASGNPKVVSLSPGDNIIFKGGVIYRGAINMGRSGTLENPITFKGDGWGTEKAVIDGSVVPSSWQRCLSSQDCGNNPNWENIYYAPLPTGANWNIPVFDSNVWLYHQIDVNLRDPFIYTTTDDWRPLASGITATSLTDPSALSHSDPNYFVGAYVQTQLPGNLYGVARITSYNPATKTVTYNPLGASPMADSQWDGKYHYAVVNNFRGLSAPGYYAVDEVNSRIYAWPRTSSANLTIGVLPHGFHTGGQSYVTISGFVIRGQYNPIYSVGIAITGSNSTPTNGIVIENCDIRNQESSGGASANVYLYGAGGATQYYRNNTMAYAYGRGILAQGMRNNVENNTFERNTGTVIFYFSSNNLPAADGLIFGNTISHCGGLHANGITIYGIGNQIAHNITVANNKVLDFGTRAGPFAVSQQASYDINFYNNIFDGQVIDDGPAPGCTYMRYYNNVIMDSLNANKGMRFSFPESCPEFKLVGNVIAGILAPNKYAAIDHRYNLYVSRSWSQASNYGWVPGTGEADASSDAIFSNYQNNNFSPKQGSPTIDAIPFGQSPVAFFTKDILNITRNLGSGWDIGPYEYFGTGSPPPLDPAPPIQPPAPPAPPTPPPTSSDTPPSGDAVFMPFEKVFNPTRSALSINYTVGSSGGTLSIFDSKGSEVKTMPLSQNGQSMWDGRNAQGQSVAAGTYLLILKSGDKIQKKKVVVVK